MSRLYYSWWPLNLPLCLPCQGASTNCDHSLRDWAGLGWAGMGWDGMGWDGMGWDQMSGGGDRILSQAVQLCSKDLGCFLSPWCGLGVGYCVHGSTPPHQHSR